MGILCDLKLVDTIFLPSVFITMVYRVAAVAAAAAAADDDDNNNNNNNNNNLRLCEVYISN